MKNPDDFLPLAAQVRPQDMVSPDMAEAYALILQKRAGGEYIDLSLLSAELPDKTMAILSRVLAQNYDVGFSGRDVEMFISRIQSGAQAAKSGEGRTDENCGRIWRV